MSAGVKTIMVKFALFGLVAVLLFIALYNTMTNEVAGEKHTLHAEFTNVSGLRTGDDVRISGVKVGRVNGIEVHDDQTAMVTFTVQADQKVSTTTRLEMRYQNLLGQKYLALTPGRRGGDLLDDGDEIGLQRTSPGFDLTTLLNGFEPLFNVLQPDDLNKLADNLVSVLQGESGSVESLMARTTELTNYLADQDQVFGEVVENLTPVVANLASNSGQFDTALVELRKLVTELNEGRGRFFGSLSKISTNLESTSDLVADVRPSLQADIRSLKALGATFRRGTPVIEDAFDALPDLVGAFVRSQSYGSHLQVYNCAFGLKLLGDEPLWLGEKDGPHSRACR